MHPNLQSIMSQREALSSSRSIVEASNAVEAVVQNRVRWVFFAATRVFIIIKSKPYRAIWR